MFTKKKDFVKEKAVIYIRVSTETQLKGHGLDSQLEKCMKTIEFKNWEYLKTYEDKAVSGTKENMEREGMSKMLEDAKKRLFDIIVIYKLDRLGRTSSIVVETVKYIVNELEINLVSCSEDIDTTRPSGRLALNMFGSIAEYEKDIIVERLTMGREQILKKRGETGGLLVYGFTREEGKKIGIDKEKAEVVKKIFQDYENGINMEQIAKNLNELKIQPPRSEMWRSSAIRKIIGNREKYEGCVRSGKNNENERWPTILKDNFKKSYVSIIGQITEILDEPKIGIYMRITNKANQKYMSLQESEIRKFLNDNNLSFSFIYRDVSPAIKIDKRFALNNLYEDIDNKKINILVVYRLNILGHNDELLEEIYKNFKDISVVSVLGY